VIRYFGGTKLGTGGLARAYSEAAKHGLQSLKTWTYSPKVTLCFDAGFEQEAQIRYIVGQAEAEITVEYGARLKVRINLNESKLEFVTEHLRRDFPQLEVRVEGG
jgi:putative IMPACT (imprinted ancient) family translation regulator